MLFEVIRSLHCTDEGLVHIKRSDATQILKFLNKGSWLLRRVCELTA